MRIPGTTVFVGALSCASALISIPPALSALGRAASARQEQPAAAGSPQAPAAQAAADEQLARAFEQQGIHFDARQGVCSIRAQVDIRDDLLEYLLVHPAGAAHESLLTTTVAASQLNTALLALGAEPGKNANWVATDPPPTLEEMRAGQPAYRVEAPQGDGFFLYLAWRAQGETYLYRIEDLIRDLDTGRSMRRHRWVYLGSRMLKLKDASKPPAFAADLEGNLISIVFFEQGNTLITAALSECLKQTIWLPNGWLLPARHEEVEMIFSRTRLRALPEAWEARLPASADDAEQPNAKEAQGDER